MRNPSPGIQLRIDALNARFRRVEQGADPATKNYNEVHIVMALMAYARPFIDDGVLKNLLHETLKEWHREHAAVRASQDAAAREVVMAIDELEALIVATPVAVLESKSIGLEAVRVLFSEVRAHPVLDDVAERARRVFDRASTAVPDQRGHATARELAQRYREARHRARTEESRYQFIMRAKPWLGAEMIDAFANSPERQADVREARFQWTSIQEIAKQLRLKDQEHGGGWHVVKTFLELVLQISIFHDHVVGKLLEVQEIDDTLRRYKARVERFEWQSYRDVVANSARGNGDEKELRRRLAIYLHDAGFDPWVEVETGSSRADGVALDNSATRDVRVTFEGKCVRPGDVVSKIKNRVRVGATQAIRYAAVHGQPTAFLVLFWASDLEPIVDTGWAQTDPPLALIVIDLRQAPSRAGGRAGTVRLCPSAKR